MVNKKRGATVEVKCVCATTDGRGRVGCIKCYGSGVVEKTACRHCGGTGKVGSKCPDCKGLGYRDIDNTGDF